LYNDFYKTFEGKDEVTPAEYRLIQKTFFNLLTRSMIYEGKVYKLPEKIGAIGVFMVGEEKKFYNFQHYKETGQKIYIRNNHSDKKQFGIKYISGDKFSSFLPISRMFKFKANRRFSRELAKAIKEKNTGSLYLPYEIHIN
jgi:hypothetical protein